MALAAIQLPDRSSRALTLAAHAAFVPIGIVTVLLSPMLPLLAVRWSLDDTQAGALFTAQFLASTLGVGLSGWLVSRRGFRFAINAGLLVMALGVAALPFSSHLLGMVCIAAYGFGIGFAVPAANLIVAEVNPARRAAALNLLNFSWSVGAVACPFLIAAASSAQKIKPFLLGVAGFMLLVLAGIAAMPASIVEPAASERDKNNGFASVNWRSPRLLVLAALFFLYVGVENSCGGWSAAFAKSLGTLRPAVAVMIPSFFYTAIMLGRWLAPLVLRRVEDLSLARMSIVIACAGMAALVVSHGMLSVVISTSVAGFGLAAVYPITISLLPREFGDSATRVGTIMFTTANLGGSLLPFLVGLCSNRFHNLRIGLLVPLVAALSIYFLYRTKRDVAAA
jgi:MFS transporter, FHS family, glucose/mannose:H+ symporter